MGDTPGGDGPRRSFLLLDTGDVGPEQAQRPRIDPAEAEEVKAKIEAHLLRHWRTTALSETTRAALAAMDQAEGLAPVLRWRRDEVLPRFPPLVLQRFRMGMRTGKSQEELPGAKPLPSEGGRSGRRGSIFAAGLRLPTVNSLPVEYRPARPPDELSRALLHAFVMLRRWEHKAEDLPAWRMSEQSRQKELLSFTADDVIGAIQAGPDELARFAAGRYMQAMRVTSHPPPLLVGLRRRHALRERLRPLVRRALELAQLVRFVELQERRRQARARRTSMVEAAAQLRRSIAEA